MEAWLVFYVPLLVAILHTHAQDDDWLFDPPADLGRPHEQPTNLTIDQAIMMSMGDTEGPSSLLEQDGLILTDGDVLLTKDMFDRVYGKDKPHDTSKRNAVKEELRWPNAEMPYSISNDFKDHEKYMLLRAMNEWERYTCFRFRPKDSTTRYWTHIHNGYGGCSAALGYTKRSPQEINLNQNGCRIKGTYMHEMGHAMGLIHEHQRPDRDDWVSIIMQNVEQQMQYNFKKYSPFEIDTMGVEYDYNSIMHYGITAFSRDGTAETIRPRYPQKAKGMGQIMGKPISYYDVEIVNKMYKCAAHCPNKNKCGTGGHLDENCNCICKDGSSDCDTTKGAVSDGNCKNVYDSWHCYIWANQGECERQSYYMKKACPKACGVCGQKSPKPATCKDVYKNRKCEVWAERGDCATNYFWMQRNCPKTCKLCSVFDAKPAENCVNKNTQLKRCENKARDGDCMIDPIGMYDHCKRSCRWCDKKLTEVFGDIRTSKWNEDPYPCKDTMPRCASKARNGGCEKNAYYMYERCPKSCNSCNDGTCKDLYPEYICKAQAKKGDCHSNFKWMRVYCAYTCRTGVCDGVGDITPTHQPPRVTTARPTQKPRPITTSAPFDPNCADVSGSSACAAWNQGSGGNFCRRVDAANYCKKTCGLCGGSGGCRDSYSQCPGWATNGDCSRNPGFMLTGCQKSCNVC